MKLILAYTICKRAGHQQCRNPTESALGQMCTNPGLLVPRTTKFFMVMPNICNIIFALFSSCIKQYESVHTHQRDSQFIPELWFLNMTLPSYCPPCTYSLKAAALFLENLWISAMGDLRSLTHLSSLEKEYKYDVNALH